MDDPRPPTLPDAATVARLEQRLARWGRRLAELEARLERPRPLPRPPAGYFQPSSAWDEDGWWSSQLGRPPA
jgi:hypothetical protein